MKKFLIVALVLVMAGAVWAQTPGGISSAMSTSMEADFTKIVSDVGW